MGGFLSYPKDCKPSTPSTVDCVIQTGTSLGTSFCLLLSSPKSILISCSPAPNPCPRVASPDHFPPKNEEKVVKKPKSLPEIGEKPHQPDISFKKSVIAGTSRNFHYKWFSEFNCLHFNEAEDKVYCFGCIKCIKENLSKKNFSKAKAFTYNGFNFWNKAHGRFRLHQLKFQIPAA